MPAPRQGLGGALHVDVFRDTVTVNTQQAWHCAPAESVNEAIAQMTQETIANLDTVITELIEHRDRLRCEVRPPHQNYVPSLDNLQESQQRFETDYYAERA
jgi:hypothetical protein